MEILRRLSSSSSDETGFVKDAEVDCASDLQFKDCDRAEQR
jgi:hypothetical protein